jgi:hypothetical protein
MFVVVVLEVDKLPLQVVGGCPEERSVHTLSPDRADQKFPQKALDLEFARDRLRPPQIAPASPRARLADQEAQPRILRGVSYGRDV